MTDAQIRDAARRVRRGDPPPDALVDLLRDAVHASLSKIRLPDAVSPYGHFGPDVHEDLLNDWLAARLLVGGGLLKLLDRAADARGLRAMAEQNFYQWLLNARPRSYAQNIYRRMVDKLAENPDRFHVVHEARRRQHEGWALVEQGSPPMFAGTDDDLKAAASAAGHIPLVRYSPDAKKLDPLVDTPELMRFCEVVIRQTAAAHTPETLMRALATRVELAPVDPDSIDELADAGQELGAEEVDVDESIDLHDTAIAVIAQITNPRVAEVIVATERRGEQGKNVAERLGVSPATVASDRKAVILLCTRFAEDLDAAARLLKEVVDLLYEGADG
jgi:DNA-binding NarL/FixJ family response regulator